jgi:RNA-directed DNA polymerase
MAACCGWCGSFLEALIQDGYRLMRPRAGTPQGGVISPLLANIYLARLDRVLEAEGVSFVRYADDGAPRRRREEAVM